MPFDSKDCKRRYHVILSGLLTLHRFTDSTSYLAKRRFASRLRYTCTTEHEQSRFPGLMAEGRSLSPRQQPLHTGCYGTELPTPTPVTSLPSVWAVVLATQAERRCWVPERPGELEVTSSRGRCCLATAFRLHLLPRLLLIPIPGFPDCQALAGGDIGAGAQPLGSQVVTGAWAQGTRGWWRDARALGRGGAEGTAPGVRGPGACWVGSRAELGTGTPPGRPGELWAAAGDPNGPPASRARNSDFNAARGRDVLCVFFFCERANEWLRKMSLLFVVKHCIWIRLSARHFSGAGSYNLDSDNPLGLVLKLVMLASAMLYCLIMERWKIFGCNLFILKIV